MIGLDRKAPIMPWYFLYLLLLYFAGKLCLSIAGDSISFGQPLSGSETIVSQDGTFELGFFPTGKSSNTYLGIWYKSFAEKTIVWLANREKPISNTSSRNLELEIRDNGNLVLFNESEIVWSTNLVLSQPSSSVEAVLLGTGNFVLRESSKPSVFLWQSFDFPTDTWLPEGKLGFRMRSSSSLEPQRLISWKSSDDPSPGIFSFEIETDTAGGQLFLEWNNSMRYWNSGTWTGEVFASVPEFSYTAKFILVSTPNETYYTYSLFNNRILSRLVMDVTGQLKQHTALHVNNKWTWSESFAQPRELSSVYAYCGDFSYSSSSSSSSCTCLQGFVPLVNENEWENGRMRGCERKAPLLCENNTSPKGKKDGFVSISMLNLPTDWEEHQLTMEGCRSACLEKCSCTAYANVGSSCKMWNGALLNSKQASDVNNNNRQDMYVKVASSELQDGSGDKKKSMVIVAVVVSVVGTALGGFLIFGTRKIKKRGHEEKNSGQDLLSFDFSSSSGAIDNQVNNVNNSREGSKNEFDLPMFSYVSVSAATSKFSAGNKLGEGGFGPVYKGKLLNGQEIAVKRLSKRSTQGLVEFRNEIRLIAKLQHQNLVRLLGCSIEQDENILVYEYMPNKSLDSFLFDSKKQASLEWETRIRIIDGIAQGLLYLHQYSRLRIIHRDLKASNILLDTEMNPKIADFGMARIFGGNNSEANTRRIVGTYGYMAPEYAMEGIFSTKSDVFSFGVLVLEIVSGKKNTRLFNSDAFNLIGHAWELWILKRALELVDPSLGSPPAVAVLRCITIGLLCVQENSNDRPTMSNVVSMLCNEVVALPLPKKPGFTTSRMMIEGKSTSSNPQNVSNNGLSFSTLEPR